MRFLNEEFARVSFYRRYLLIFSYYFYRTHIIHSYTILQVIIYCIPE